MSDTVQSATAQPEQVAQKSAEKTVGAGNSSLSDFAKKIAAAQTAPAAFTPKTEAVIPKVEAKAETPAQTEEPKQAPIAEEKTEETKEEAKAETEETEVETEEVLSPEAHALDPKLQAKIDRRIGKEVAKRKALEQEVAALKALVVEKPQVEEKEVVVQVPSNVPLADIKNQAELEQLKIQARTEIRWAEQWLDEDIPAEGIQTDRGPATKKQLKELIRNARIVQEDLIPEREKWLNAHVSAKQNALTEFPFLKDPTHPGYAIAQAARRDPANAWLHSLPNADYVLGVQVEGLLALQARKAATTAKPTPKPKPRPTGGQSEIASDASITRAPTGMMNAQALQAERAKATGGKKSLGHKDFAQLLIANARFRNSQ